MRPQTSGAAPQAATNPAATAAPAPPAVASIVAWKAQAAPVAWAGGRVFYNQRGASGIFDGWSAIPTAATPRA